MNLLLSAPAQKACSQVSDSRLLLEIDISDELKEFTINNGIV